MDRDDDNPNEKKMTEQKGRGQISAELNVFPQSSPGETSAMGAGAAIPAEYRKNLGPQGQQYLLALDRMATNEAEERRDKEKNRLYLINAAAQRISWQVAPLINSVMEDVGQSSELPPAEKKPLLKSYEQELKGILEALIPRPEDEDPFAELEKGMGGSDLDEESEAQSEAGEEHDSEKEIPSRHKSLPYQHPESPSALVRGTTIKSEDDMDKPTPSDEQAALEKQELENKLKRELNSKISFYLEEIVKSVLEIQAQVPLDFVKDVRCMAQLPSMSEQELQDWYDRDKTKDVGFGKKNEDLTLTERRQMQTIEIKLMIERQKLFFIQKCDPQRLVVENMVKQRQSVEKQLQSIEEQIQLKEEQLQFMEKDVRESDPSLRSLKATKEQKQDAIKNYQEHNNKVMANATKEIAYVAVMEAIERNKEAPVPEDPTTLEAVEHTYKLMQLQQRIAVGNMQRFLRDIWGALGLDEADLRKINIVENKLQEMQQQTIADARLQPIPILGLNEATSGQLNDEVLNKLLTMLDDEDAALKEVKDRRRQVFVSDMLRRNLEDETDKPTPATSIPFLWVNKSTLKTLKKTIEKRMQTQANEEGRGESIPIAEDLCAYLSPELGWNTKLGRELVAFARVVGDDIKPHVTEDAIHRPRPKYGPELPDELQGEITELDFISMKRLARVILAKHDVLSLDAALAGYPQIEMLPDGIDSLAPKRTVHVTEKWVFSVAEETEESLAMGYTRALPEIPAEKSKSASEASRSDADSDLESEAESEYLLADQGKIKSLTFYAVPATRTPSVDVFDFRRRLDGDEIIDKSIEVVPPEKALEKPLATGPNPFVDEVEPEWMELLEKVWKLVPLGLGAVRNSLERVGGSQEILERRLEFGSGSKELEYKQPRSRGVVLSEPDSESDNENALVIAPEPRSDGVVLSNFDLLVAKERLLGQPWGQMEEIKELTSINRDKLDRITLFAATDDKQSVLIEVDEWDRDSNNNKILKTYICAAPFTSMPTLARHRKEVCSHLSQEPLIYFPHNLPFGQSIESPTSSVSGKGKAPVRPEGWMPLPGMAGPAAPSHESSVDESDASSISESASSPNVEPSHSREGEEIEGLAESLRRMPTPGGRAAASSSTPRTQPGNARSTSRRVNVAVSVPEDDVLLAEQLAADLARPGATLTSLPSEGKTFDNAIYLGQGLMGKRSDKFFAESNSETKNWDTYCVPKELQGKLQDAARKLPLGYVRVGEKVTFSVDAPVQDVGNRRGGGRGRR